MLETEFFRLQAQDFAANRTKNNSHTALSDKNSVSEA